MKAMENEAMPKQDESMENGNETVTAVDMDWPDELIEQPRASFFNRVLRKIYDIWPHKTKNQTAVETPSRFRMIAEDLQQDDPEYENVSAAAQLCEEALKIARHRIKLVSDITKLDGQMAELESYGKLTEEEATQLKNLLHGFMGTVRDRDVLRNQLTDFHREIDGMEKLEDDAVTAIPQMQDAEKMQRILKRDAGHLVGEKAELEHERGVLETALDFINKMAVVIVIIFGIAAVYLVYSYMVAQRSIMIPGTIMILAAIIMAAGLYLFRRKVAYEIKLNIKKQKRAVEILNKKNTVLAYYTSFLNYEYKKYKVRNSKMLQANLKEYANYKYVTGRIDAIRNIMYETENQIEKFMRNKKIDSGNFTIEQFANTVNIDNKQNFYRDLAAKKQDYEAKLADMDAKHKQLWSFIEEMNAVDQTKDKLVGLMVQTYFDEVAKLFKVHDKKEENAY